MEILFPNRSPQFSTQKGGLRKRSGPTAKRAAELGVSQYSHAMTMTLRLRKFTLTAHVIFSVGWLGAVVAYLLRSSLVSRHTRLKGRVVKSAGIRSYRERSGPDRWHNRPGVDGVVADKAQTHCPRLERLVPKVLKNREVSRYL